MELSARQSREVEYHRGHAEYLKQRLNQPFSYAVLSPASKRRWENAYWEMYRYVRDRIVSQPGPMRALVVGCGAGDDALRLAKLGLEVYAFDLSPESLEVARALAEREGAQIAFIEAPAEKLPYEDKFFDMVLAVDILHHVDIPQCVAQLRRVSKRDAYWVINEIYSHSWTELVRRSWLVERVLYPMLRAFVYKRQAPYITPDERKMTEGDIRLVTDNFAYLHTRKFFNCIVTRLLPDSSKFLNTCDRLLLCLLHPMGRFLAGRIFIVGRVP